MPLLPTTRPGRTSLALVTLLLTLVSLYLGLWAEQEALGWRVHTDAEARSAIRCRNPRMQSRRAVSVLFDWRTGHSDAVPPVSEVWATSLLHGPLPVPVAWPSATVAPALHAFAAEQQQQPRRSTPPGSEGPLAAATGGASRRAQDILAEYTAMLGQLEMVRATPPAKGNATPPSVVTVMPAYVRCAKRNAIVAVASSYKADRMQHFVSSFQRYHGPCDELILMVDIDRVVPGLSVDASKPNVVLLPQQEWMTGTSPIMVRRIEALRKWVVQHWQAYHYIVTVDVRDAVFFGNAFDALASRNVSGIFSVAEVWALHEQQFNRHWVHRYTEVANISTAAEKRGDAVLETLGSMRLNGDRFPVLCAGLYGGTALAMLDYLTVYSQAMELGIVPDEALDQGLHIILQMAGLARLRFPHPIVVLDDEVGPMRHYFHEKDVVVRDPLGRVVNCLLEPYAIVHQLDRYGPPWSEAIRPYGTFDASAVDSNGAKAACSPKPAPNDGAPAAAATEQRFNPVVADDGPQASGTAPRGRAWQHYTTVCTGQNALLVFVERWRAREVEQTVAAFQRHHTVCDKVVVFVRAGTDVRTVTAGKMPVVEWWEYAEGTANATATGAVAEYLGERLREGAGLEEVVVLSLGGGEAEEWTGIFGNVFATGRAGATDGAVWGLPYLPSERSALAAEQRPLVGLAVAEAVACMAGWPAQRREEAAVLDAAARATSVHPGAFGGRSEAVLRFAADVQSGLAGLAPCGRSQTWAAAEAVVRSHVVPARAGSARLVRLTEEAEEGSNWGYLRGFGASVWRIPVVMGFRTPARCDGVPYALVVGLSGANGSPGSRLKEAYDQVYARPPGAEHASVAFLETTTLGQTLFTHTFSAL